MLFKRRQCPRLKEKHKVALTVMPGEDPPIRRKKKLTCWTVDLSTGGVRLLSRKRLPIGSGVRVHIECSHPMEEYELSGRVMWTGNASERERFLLGVNLVPTVREKMLSWCRMIDRRMSS